MQKQCHGMEKHAQLMLRGITRLDSIRPMLVGNGKSTVEIKKGKTLLIMIIWLFLMQFDRILLNVQCAD